MRRLVAFIGAVALAVTALLTPVAASPECRNCPPTVVVVGAGTVTVLTDAVPNGGCIGAVSPTKYLCNVYIEGVVATFGYYTDGGPTTVPVGPGWGCPCVAAFKVHSGQWHQYSADSAPFTP